MNSNIDCESIARSVKEVTDKVIVVALTAHIGGQCANADYILSSHEPEQLVALMRFLFGDPRVSTTK
jgi:hypothetical protein